MMRLAPLALLLLMLAGGAGAQERAAGAATAPPEPVAFTAEAVEYDRDRGIVTATGRVEAWQGGRILRAERLTYDRNTGVAIAEGSVQLIEADGTVLFADRAELKDRFRDGVLEGVRALLAANGRLAANGARRTAATTNELARAVYSSCDLCARDPTRPPTWQLEARRATQDSDQQRLTYRDATVRIAGVPLLYTPYISAPDPAVPRASGFLFPTLGVTRFLGGFAAIPYFWAINPSTDLTITPTFSTRQLPNLALEYRQLFNFGDITAQGSIGGFNGNDSDGREELGGHIYSRGRFALNETWRAGFELNRATDEEYLRTFRFDFRRVLTSQVFVEGFRGTEFYARADVRAYQGLREIDDTRQIPFVLPNVLVEQAPRERVLGGRLVLDAGVLGIVRSIGSDSQRLAARARWERPEIDRFGGLWTLRVQSEARGYNANGQGELPTNLPDANGTQAVGNVRAAVDWRMPFVRRAGGLGTQTIEPRVQLVAGPRLGQQTDIPNDDSVDFEFTDANLFALNRFTGRDRQEGGSRVDAALRGAWDFPNGGQVEGLVGRSLRLDGDRQSPYPASGLERRASDTVARLRVAPVPWFETLGRIRLDSENGERRFADAVASVAVGGGVSVNAGYLYSPPVPYLLPVGARDEVSAGFAARIGAYWRVSATGSFDVARDRPAAFAASAGYEDECLILESRFVQRFGDDLGSSSGTQSGTLLLFRIGFKTVGEYALRAL